MRADEQVAAADDLQRVLNLCQHLRKYLNNEQSKSTIIKEEMNVLTEQLAEMTKNVQQQEQVINALRREVGMCFLFCSFFDCEIQIDVR